MKIAKVVGVAISTVKEPRLEDSKLLLVSDADQTGKAVISAALHCPRCCWCWDLMNLSLLWKEVLLGLLHGITTRPLMQ